MSREHKDTVQYARTHDPETERVYAENPTTRGSRAKKAAVIAFIAAMCAAAIAAVAFSK